jgi:hypothetical protein
MAGTDAAKQSKVLEAAFQMALKLPYPGGQRLKSKPMKWLVSTEND